MSYDKLLDQVCTHEVVEEALFLNSDRQTLRTLRPIANVVSVGVRFNRLETITPLGKHTPALGKGSAPGPFQIKAGVNDTLVVSVDAGPDQTVVVPAGNALSAAVVADSLSKSVAGASFQVSSRNQVQGLSQVEGLSSRLEFKAGSTIAETLGITLSRVYRGQTIIPRWSFIDDPNTLSDFPTRLIVFDETIKGTNDFFEISYTTRRQECRRCGGTGVENDWRYDMSGQVLRAEGATLLVQELLKATYTQSGSNPFHEWYGTQVVEAIGKKQSSQGITQNMIISDLQTAFRRWQDIKRQQEQVVGQFVSDEEYPFNILTTNLTASQDDPTVVLVSVLVQNRSNQPIQITRGVRLPEPTDLLGSTVQESLRRKS